MVSYPSMGAIMSLFSAGANYGSGRRLCAGLLAAGGIARGVRGATPDFFSKNTCKIVQSGSYDARRYLIRPTPW